VYSLAMVALRLSGNRLLQRFRTERLLPVLAGLATVGFGIALALGQVPATLFGFACLGAGLAVVIPTVFSAAGRLPGINAGTAVALVSAFWMGRLRLRAPAHWGSGLVGLPALGSAVVAIAHFTCRFVHRQGRGSSHRWPRAGSQHGLVKEPSRRT
jgi:hypothetical protein